MASSGRTVLSRLQAAGGAQGKRRSRGERRRGRGACRPAGTGIGKHGIVQGRGECGGRCSTEDGVAVPPWAANPSKRKQQQQQQAPQGEQARSGNRCQHVQYGPRPYPRAWPGRHPPPHNTGTHTHTHTDTLTDTWAAPMPRMGWRACAHACTHRASADEMTRVWPPSPG